MKIAILDDYQAIVSQLECYSLLQEFRVKIFTEPFASELALIKALQDFEIIVLIRERSKITRNMINQLPKLRFISQTGRLGNHIDLEACETRGIVVRGGNGNPHAPAELTWALVLAAQKRLHLYLDSLSRGQWQSSEPLQGKLQSMGRSLRGKTLGIVGLGKIGSLVAQFATAFGMKVVVFGREQSLKAAQERGYQIVHELCDLFSSSEVVSVHLRACKETVGFIKTKHFEKMSQNSVFINTSRDSVVERGAIQNALNQNFGPAVFALDVHEVEPILSPVCHPRLLLTPHLGYTERETFEMYFSDAFNHILVHSRASHDSE